MLATLAALLTLQGSPAAADPQPPAPAAHVQSVEAFAAADIEKAAPTAIVALNARQLHDPNFRPLANALGDALARRGFNMVARGERFQNVVTLDWRVNRDVNGDLPGQGASDPRVQKRLGLAAFPAYRRLTVTAYAVRPRGHAQLLWRTVMAEDGFEHDVARTIPALVQAGSPYFGRSLTPLAVADCGADAPIGSHIPARPCDVVRTRLSGDTVRSPQVIVGPMSTPDPSVAAPPRP